MQDWAEEGNEPLILLLLDWEKAFDKISQEELIEAVERMNVPDKLIKVVKSFYVNPQFRINDRKGSRSHRNLASGKGVLSHPCISLWE